MSIFTGAGVALVTPMHADGSVNFDKMKELIEFQIANDTDALIICGTTGEASTMSDEVQIECIRFAKEAAAGRVPVIAGAGSNDTAHCIALAQGCEKAGADAVLLVTPYYNKATQKGLILHYTAVANSINIPIILYNVPGRTGCNIAPKTVAELAKVKNIVAVKEASGNLSQVAEIAALVGPDFDIYSGNDDQILPVLSLGGKGVISVLSNVALKQERRIQNHCLGGVFLLRLGNLSVHLRTDIFMGALVQKCQLFGIMEDNFPQPSADDISFCIQNSRSVILHNFLICRLAF